MEQQPEAAVTATAPQKREDTPWPNTMPASTNLFDARASWPIPQMEAPTAIKMEKAEEMVQPSVAANPYAMVNKPPQGKAGEMCGWGLHCPICAKSIPNPKVESSDDKQNNLQRNYYPQGPQCSPSYDILDSFAQQLKLEKEWNERMEHLNDKYNVLNNMDKWQMAVLKVKVLDQTNKLLVKSYDSKKHVESVV